MTAAEQYLKDANGWPGLAALAALENGDEPAAVELLDGLDAAELGVLARAAERLEELAHERSSR